MGFKEENPHHAKALGVSGLNGKSITDVHVSQKGSGVVIELSYSGGSQMIKVYGGQVEIGGTADVGTGTQVYF